MTRLTADQRRILDLAACFNTPIVFEPGGWDADCPEWLRLRVVSERVELVDAGQWDRATDAEICCYLFTASLNRPLTSDWTDIYLYESAKEVPQIGEVLEATPKELTEYQQRELLDLKFKIRNSQLRRKKEVPMSKRKIVLDEKDTTVIMGIMKENADPILKTIDGKLEDAVAAIPQLITDAEVKWATSLRNPTYKETAVPKPAAPTPKPTAKPKAGKPEPGAKPNASGTGDLPLLSDAETPAAPAEAPAPTEERAAGDAGPLVAAAEQAPTPAAAAPAAAEPAHAPAEAAAQAAPPAAPAAQATPPGPAATAAVTQPATTSSATGQWQYKLEDGRGPFNSVQEAMDSMGLDKATRPQHNRWDRLSTDLKKKILRVEKSS